VGLSLLLLFLGWLLNEWLAPKLNPQTTSQVVKSRTNSSKTQAIAQQQISSPASDPFAQAVRLAEQASTAGKTIQTSAQWLDVAAKWERASDLMKAVKPDDQRYKTAQDRMKLYRQNSEAAQKQATQRRS
jgi:hypothetical protein